MNRILAAAALAAAFSALTVQANAGVLCAFNTPDRQGFSFGYVEGSGQAPDFLTGMYRQYASSNNGHVTKWDEKSGGPAWAYSITNGRWALVSVDSANRIHDAGRAYPGVCEIGGAI